MVVMARWWSGWLKQSRCNDSTIWSSYEIPFASARSAGPCTVPCGCCQKLVQPTISPHSDKPLEVWAWPSSLRAPHSAANAPPCAGPLLLQRTGDIQGISHIACISIPRTVPSLCYSRTI